jgi:DNA-binding NarL/FixJ family response regulator
MATVGLQICDVVDCQPRKKDPVGNREECVLLIEDSEEAMLLVRYALQEYGNGTYRLEWADGLTAGLHRLAKGDVDLIILDLGLPESSGAASYASLRKAAPDLPVLVLTSDTREQTESAVAVSGVEDYLVKDEVSGALLIQAIRRALYANRRWQEQKNATYKRTQRFVWAQEKCQALSALATRMLKLNRIEAAMACAKAICGMVENYGESEGAAVAGRADLFVELENLARAAATQGLREPAREFRAMMAPPAKADRASREEFAVVMKQRIAQLGRDPALCDAETPVQDSADLAQLLRQILESVPTLG